MNVMLLEKTLLERLVGEGKSHDQYSLIRHAIQPAVGKLAIKAYEFSGYTHKISGMKSYFAANMELLDPQVRAELFPNERPVFTKVRDEVPVKYGLSARGGQLADRRRLHHRRRRGELHHLPRRPRSGATRCSRTASSCRTPMSATTPTLEYVITDKDVLIKDSRVLIGYETYPAYIAKGNSI